MKQAIRQYLLSLRERNELDDVIPDLLSEMRLNVYSRPAIGVRQHGVDVAAVGSLDGGPESVYLFSIKAKHLTRQSWNGAPTQSLRPSLEEIVDNYIPTCIPAEHHGKPIVIVICLGGDVQQDVRQDVTQFIARVSQKNSVVFLEWNGDRLADYIDRYLLNEALLPAQVQSSLRKCLALLDEPNAALGHFAQVVSALTAAIPPDPKKRDTILRQMTLCLWIVYSWARDIENLEAPVLCSERVILCCWPLARADSAKTGEIPIYLESYNSLLRCYLHIHHNYVAKIANFAGFDHAISAVVTPQHAIDVNLKLFDVMGRMATLGSWYQYLSEIIPASTERYKEQYLRVCKAVVALINSNPCLLSPIHDGQGIDIGLAILLFSYSDGHTEFIDEWIHGIIGKTRFAFLGNKAYPCIHGSYRELLDHPKRDENYRNNATASSTLYPMLAMWSSVLDMQDAYAAIQNLKSQILPHSDFQIWYPNADTEANIYVNVALHGAMLSPVPISASAAEYRTFLWNEARATSHFEQLSCVQHGLVPLVLVACRHYRLPVPVHFTLSYFKSDAKAIDPVG